MGARSSTAGRRTAGVAALAATLASAEVASAYTYPEHFVLTRRAIADLHRIAPGPTDEAFRALYGVLPGSRLAAPENLEDPSRPVPPTRFDVADLPALASDHSIDPQNLADRWLYTAPDQAACAEVNLSDGIAFLDDNFESPELCMSRNIEGGTRAACNPDLFLATVRSYHDARDMLALHPTCGIDTRLAAADCAYVCLAERGRLHFRLPGVPPRIAAQLPTLPNAAFAYLRFHTMAVELAKSAATASAADNARARFLGYALVHELFALHFLQDATAAGHTVAPHQNFGNATVTATHDWYNREGLKVVLPPITCRRALTWRPAFPVMRGACAQHLAQAVVRGDHAISGGLTAEPVDGLPDVSVELGEMLGMESMRAVLAAARPRGVPQSKVPPTSIDEACAVALGIAAPAEGASARCPRGWMGLDAETRAWLTAHAAEEGGADTVLDLLPVAIDVAKPIEVPGGVNLAFRFSTRSYSFESGDLLTSLGVGGAYLAPTAARRVSFGGDVEFLYASYSADRPSDRLGVGGHVWAAVAPFQGRYTSRYELEGGVAVEFLPTTPLGAATSGARRVAISGYVDPISWELISSDIASVRLAIPVGLGGAFDVPLGAARTNDVVFGYVGFSATLLGHGSFRR